MVKQFRVACYAAAWCVAQTMLAADGFDLHPGRAGRPETSNDTPADRQIALLSHSAAAVRDALDFHRIEHTTKKQAHRKTTAMRRPAIITTHKVEPVTQQYPGPPLSAFRSLGYRLFPIVMLLDAERWIGLFRTTESSECRRNWLAPNSHIDWPNNILPA